MEEGKRGPKLDSGQTNTIPQPLASTYTLNRIEWEFLVIFANQQQTLGFDRIKLKKNPLRLPLPSLLLMYYTAIALLS